MTTPAIEARGVVRHFGAVRAVDGVDLAVRGGELFGLIGHNGAGKSTLFKLMLGLVAPGAGEIRIGGERQDGRAFRAIRRGLGYLPENVVLYDNLSGRETLRFFADLKGAPRGECEALLARVGLGHAADRRVREYSKGMRQRLGFAQALLGAPRYLFLDEPTNGLDPEGIREFYAILRTLRDEGVTIVLTSHILSEIQQRVDRLAIMKSGRVHATGSVQELREAIGLPLSVDLRFAPAAREQLAGLIDAMHLDASAFDGERARLRCPRPRKMELLGALATLGGAIIDLQLREPTLEDVFLGHAAEEDA